MYNNYTKIIRDSLVEDMNEKIKVYNSKLSKLQNEQSIPELYEMLVGIYGNSTKQAEVAEKLLKESLTNEFFKKADVVYVLNEIRFYSEKHYVSFPTSRIKEIKIVALNLSRPYSTSTFEVDELVELFELANKFLKNKNLANLKKLNNFDTKYVKHKNSIQKLYSLYSTYKTFDRNKIDEIENHITLIREKKSNHEKKLEAYKNKYDEALKFAYSLKELSEWNKSGWTIAFSGESQEKRKTYELIEL